MKGRGGFTLVETLLAVAITCICVGLFLPFLGSQRKVWERDTAIGEEAETLAAAVQWITRNLQSAGYGWKGSPLTELDGGRISFVTVADDPARYPDSRQGMRHVSVYTAAGDLYCRVRRWDSLRGDWRRGSSHKLASGLEGFAVSGLTFDGTPAGSPDGAAAVEMMLRGRRSGVHRGFVVLRNGAGRNGGGT